MALDITVIDDKRIVINGEEWYILPLASYVYSLSLPTIKRKVRDGEMLELKLFNKVTFYKEKKKRKW